MSALTDLAQDGILSQRVSRALGFLQSDEDPIVALTAIVVLERAGTNIEFDRKELHGVYIDELRLGASSERLTFVDSFVTDVTCDECEVYYYRSIAPPFSLGLGATLNQGSLYVGNTIYIDTDAAYSLVLYGGEELVALGRHSRSVIPVGHNRTIAERLDGVVLQVGDRKNVRDGEPSDFAVLTGPRSGSNCEALQDFTSHNVFFDFEDQVVKLD